MTSITEAGVAWEQVFSAIVFDADRLRHACLADELCSWIDQGKLPTGLRLPSTRRIAQRLGMGRNTVLFALNCLVENGYLESRERSGIFVGAPSRFIPSHGRTVTPSRAAPDWFSRIVTCNEELTSRSRRPGVHESLLSFRFGAFDPSIFPLNHWRECERAANAYHQVANWGRDMVDGDDPGLVEQIRMHVLPRAGIWARPEEIMITVGAQEGRFLISHFLRQARIGIENPCSLELARTLRFCGTEPISLPVDDEGLIPSDDFDRCNVVFLTPGHQNPTTVPLSAERRRLLLDRAECNDMILVEDTFDTEFLHERGGMPALKSQDSEGRVIYIASLSRQMAPGLRLGFIVAPVAVIEHLRVLRRLIHRHPPANNQRSLAIFIERGYYRRFVRQATHILEERGKVLAIEAARQLPDFRLRFQPGTSCFWVRMPEAVNSDTLAHEARGKGLIIDHAGLFHDTGDSIAHCIRLTVSGVNESGIRRGLTLLAEARDQLRQPA